MFNYRNPKLRLDIQSQKTICFLITLTISLNIQKEKFGYRSDLERTIFASFPSNCLNYLAIIFSLQKLSNLTIAKIATSTRTNITLQRIVKLLRAIKMCSAFNPDSLYDNSIF